MRDVFGYAGLGMRSSGSETKIDRNDSANCVVRGSCNIRFLKGILGHTFGVCDLTFPARARDPWTLPMIASYNSLIAFRNSR